MISNPDEKVLSLAEPRKIKRGLSLKEKAKEFVEPEYGRLWPGNPSPYQPEEMNVVNFYRFEGISDPDLRLTLLVQSLGLHSAKPMFKQSSNWNVN